MPNIYFVRHGETSWNRRGTYQGDTNVPLNHRGLMQAELCAAKLKDVNFKKIITSDLSRALTTASMIKEFHDESSFKIDSRLREVNFGDWEGLTFEEIEERWPGMIMAMYSGSDEIEFPNGESFEEMQTRAWEAVVEALEDCEEEDNILVVCHGGTVRALLCRAIDLSLKYAWNFRQGNTAISIVEYYGDGYFNTIQLLNDTSHIDNMKGSNLCG